MNRQLPTTAAATQQAAQESRAALGRSTPLAALNIVPSPRRKTGHEDLDSATRRHQRTMLCGRKLFPTLLPLLRSWPKRSALPGFGTGGFGAAPQPGRDFGELLSLLVGDFQLLRDLRVAEEREQAVPLQPCLPIPRAACPKFA
jgi:hypothetical protein